MGDQVMDSSVSSMPDNLTMTPTRFRIYGTSNGPTMGEADTLEEAVAIAKSLNHYERKARYIEERERDYPHKLVARYTPTGKERK